MRVAELFAGVGGFRIGFERASESFKTVWSNQWEPSTKKQDASEIYQKWFGSEGHSNEDINLVKTEDIPDHDLLCCGFPCLTGDTLVLTSDGYKYITDVKEGDMVLGHDNQYHIVNKLMNQGIKQTYKIKANGFDTIEATGNHKFLVREKIQKYTRVKGKYVYIKKFSQPEWKSVDELRNCYKNYYMGSAINQNSIIPEWKGITLNKNQSSSETYCNLDMTDENLWYIIGRFLGDGWLRKQFKKGDLRYKYSGIIICCAKDEIEEFTSKISDKYSYSIAEERTVYKLHFCSMELAHFCEQFYSGDIHSAKTKRLPGFVFDLPVNLLEQLLRGYRDSDGCTTDIYNQFASISRELLYGIAHCIEKVYHKPALISINNVPDHGIIEGRLVNRNKFYTLKYRHSEPQRSTSFYEDGYIWYPILKIEEYIEQPVYDIEVDESHSFIANHCITHNCQDYSVANTLSRSGGIEGKKGVLWWQIYRILKEKGEHRPDYLFFENVDRLLNSPANQRGRDFAIILASLSDLGYVVEWRVINAAEYGMPQRRRRTYILGYKKGSEIEKKIDGVIHWLVDDGVFAKAFPMTPKESTSPEFRINGDLKEVSDLFNKGKKKSPFKGAGIMWDRKVVSFDYNPVYDSRYGTTLGDILQDESEVGEEFFIPDDMVDKWRDAKDAKKIDRVSKDGFEYTFSAGAMAFPDYLDRPSRTIITGEGGSSPSRFKHVVKTPSGRYRRLTPVELERLNMFPDDHTEGVSATRRAFLMGNALVCGVIERTARVLIEIAESK